MQLHQKLGVGSHFPVAVLSIIFNSGSSIPFFQVASMIASNHAPVESSPPEVPLTISSQEEPAPKLCQILFNNCKSPSSACLESTPLSAAKSSISIASLAKSVKN